MDSIKLSEQYPELAQQWHPQKNGSSVIDDFTKGSHKKVWWKCDKGSDHEWQTSIQKRTRNNGSNCPFCAGQKVSLTNSFATNYPELAMEWHPLKNINISIEQLVVGSTQKVWWKCKSNPTHEWQTTIAKRTKKSSGCPFCLGRKVSYENSLAQLFPEIASEWDYIKNGDLKPLEIVAGSSKKVWWKCKLNPEHSWLAAVVSRAKQSRGCPYCCGKNILPSDSLGTLFPEKLKEFDNEKNINLDPFKLSPGSHKKVWWKCKKDFNHKWQAAIYTRTGKMNCGCPFCSGRNATPKNSLKYLFPEIAKEWHPAKNENLLPENIVPGSSKKVWWKCKKGTDHEWQTHVYNRTRGNSSCPFCSNHRASKTNSLDILFPDIAKEWHPTKNDILKPSDFLPNSNKKIWWQCLQSKDHVWNSSVSSRTRQQTNCPFCTGRKPSKQNSFATKYPQLIKEWHPTKNALLIPENFTYGSGKKVWWQCSTDKEHEWEATIHSRTNSMKSRGNGCPYCANQKVSDKNSLLFNFPELSKEWDYKKNDLSPSEVVSGYSKLVWWKCSQNSEHSWQASPSQRTRIKTGCPFCTQKGWTVEKIRLFIKSILEHLSTFTPSELYTAFLQSGLLTTEGKGKTFVKALVTGRFPQEEIEKFVQGEPSLVDDFIQDPELTLEVHQSSNQDLIDIDSETVNEGITDEEMALPTVKTKEVLASLNHELISSADSEAIDFFIASALAKIWRHAFADENEAVSQARSFKGDTYAEEVRQDFIRQYEGAKSLEIPDGYAFPSPPNLMQKLAAYKVVSEQRVGNWSGTGAGKTLSAILASRVIDAELTIICCPNSVVEGWIRNILQIFPKSEVVSKNWEPQWLTPFPRYLVMNYEAFQQPDTGAKLKALLAEQSPDFIVIDEIHYAKQRQIEQMSLRKQHVLALVTESGHLNSNLSVLGMSATPVINNLQEGRSLIELVSGVEHKELETKATLPNCVRLHQKLVTMGIRWLPNYEYGYEQAEIPVDCSDYLDEIKALGKNGNPLALESLLTLARLPIIRENIKPKTLIYTHYIQDIDKILYDALKEDGWSVGFYTGDDKSGLNEFIDGNLDVLIGSSAISTGVDRLQEVCNNLIINVLPWTHAEFLQLKGRIYRQGQRQDKVKVIIPVTYANLGDQHWSWCESKLHRLKFKKSIADAAVDGIIPEGHLRSAAQAYQDVMIWLERIEDGNVQIITRKKIVVPLPESDDKELQKRVRKYGDFSQMNQRWNQSESTKTHQRLKQNPEEWMEYHTQYRKARESWTITPFEEMIKWFQQREGYHIGDFGCGEALLAEELKDKHVVYSFDHVAIHDYVIACDMRNVPIEDETFDAAIFSLSLMGHNFGDYIKEAHRTLKLDGQLHIIEATSRFSDRNEFCRQLEKFGFDIYPPKDVWKFTHLRAIKSLRSTKSGIEISF